MFKKETFGTTHAQDALSSLYGRFTFPEDGSLEKVSDILEELFFSLKVFSEAPKYVLTRSLYPTVEGGDVLSSARFILRPSVSHTLEIAPLRKEIMLLAGADFFDRLISEVAQWFDVWQYHKQLQVNLDVFNQEIATLIEENEIPFSIRFGLGAGLLDASDNHAVVGLSEGTIASLSSLPLFDTQLESRRQGYQAKIVEGLRELSNPYSIVKLKSKFVKDDLGIYSRRDINKLMRDFVNRSINFVRVGTGYYEDKTTFALITKVAVTEAEAAEMGEGVKIIDNDKASEKEKAAGKTKIAVYFKVSPFEKDGAVPTEVSLDQVLTVA